MATPKPSTLTILGYRVQVARGIGVCSADRAAATGQKAGLPADMLRYDLAFENPAFPKVVLFLTYRVRRFGVHQGLPTFRRWESFSIRLESAPDELDFAVQRDAKDNPAAWITFRHTRSDHRLEPVSLKDFLSEEAARA